MIGLTIVTRSVCLGLLISPAHSEKVLWFTELPAMRVGPKRPWSEWGWRSLRSASGSECSRPWRMCWPVPVWVPSIPLGSCSALVLAEHLGLALFTASGQVKSSKVEVPRAW